MIRRSLSRVARACLLGAVVAGATVVVPATTAHAEPPGDDTVVAFLARGVGYGHGRGMSQWGAYGRASAGQSYTQILDHYYGGTSMGARTGDIRVRLTDWDGRGTFGVVSTQGKARWSGAGQSSANDYASLYAIETSSNTFDIYGIASGRSCPSGAAVVVPESLITYGMTNSTAVEQMQRVLRDLGHDPSYIDGDFGNLTKAALDSFQRAQNLPAGGTTWNQDDWERAKQLLANQSPTTWTKLKSGVQGPITFSTTVADDTAVPGDVLGACQPDGSITHYRGDLEFWNTGDGNRVVNELDTELYLRGVVPKEVSASWPTESLKAQAVAARSYGLHQSRYSYASTCDTSSCQVYFGAATRGGATSSGFTPVEHARTNAAIAATAGDVRVWSGTNDLVSTEFSASNGPRTAGGSFPAVNDPFDDVEPNPLHEWTRIIDADSIMSRYGLSSADAVATVADPTVSYDGIWDNRVSLGNGNYRSAWNFRGDYGLPSPGFELVPIRRTMTNAVDFAFIGDSIGTGMALGSSSEFQVLTDEVFDAEMYSAVSGRTTAQGVAIAETVPIGTDLVVVELGYNDTPSAMPDRIDAMMTALAAREVGLVVWPNLSTRRSGYDYAAVNAALDDARSDWPNLVVADWNARSGHAAGHRWFHSDGVHLTSTGEAEFSLFLRERILQLLADGYTPPRRLGAGQTLEVPVLGVGGVPATGVSGVALNVTSVKASANGHLTVWPCGTPRPETSSVNFRAGVASPNAVVVPIDATGAICVWSLVETDLIVDVSAWFGDSASMEAAQARLVSTREGIGTAATPLPAGRRLEVPVLATGGVPASGVSGVALNVTAVQPSANGHLTVWPCGAEQPDTSSVNYRAGVASPNAVVVPVDATGKICVWTLATTHVIVDVSAWFADSASMDAATARLIDTRNGTGTAEVRLPAQRQLEVPVLGLGGVPGSGVSGVALNVTSVQPSANGHLTVWPCGSPRPDTSSVNFRAGVASPNAVVVPVDATGSVCVWTFAETDVLVDVSAWFGAGAAMGVSSDRLVDTRSGIGPQPEG